MTSTHTCAPLIGRLQKQPTNVTSRLWRGFPFETNILEFQLNISVIRSLLKKCRSRKKHSNNELGTKIIIKPCTLPNIEKKQKTKPVLPVFWNIIGSFALRLEYWPVNVASLLPDFIMVSSFHQHLNDLMNMLNNFGSYKKQANKWTKKRKKKKKNSWPALGSKQPRLLISCSID